MSDVLDRIRRDIQARMNELEPFVREAESLERSLEELDSMPLRIGAAERRERDRPTSADANGPVEVRRP